MDGAKPTLADGELVLQFGKKTDAADLRLPKPVLYQEIAGERRSVEGSFTVAANGEVAFEVGAYNHTRELVIDPILSYISYFGGSGEDRSAALPSMRTAIDPLRKAPHSVAKIDGAWTPNTQDADQAKRSHLPVEFKVFCGR